MFHHGHHDRPLADLFAHEEEGTALYTQYIILFANTSQISNSTEDIRCTDCGGNFKTDTVTSHPPIESIHHPEAEPSSSTSVDGSSSTNTTSTPQRYQNRHIYLPYCSLPNSAQPSPLELVYDVHTFEPASLSDPRIVEKHPPVRRRRRELAKPKTGTVTPSDHANRIESDAVFLRNPYEHLYNCAHDGRSPPIDSSYVAVQAKDRPFIPSSTPATSNEVLTSQSTPRIGQPSQRALSPSPAISLTQSTRDPTPAPPYNISNSSIGPTRALDYRTPSLPSLLPLNCHVPISRSTRSQLHYYIFIC